MMRRSMQMPGMRPMSQCPRTAIMLPPVQFFDMAGERLGLTADQKQNIKGIMEKATQASRPLVEKSSQANDALKTGSVLHAGQRCGQHSISGQ